MIYEPRGCSFVGSLESFKKIHPAKEPAAAHSTQDPYTREQRLVDPPPQHQQRSGKRPAPPSIDTYRQVLNLGHEEQLHQAQNLMSHNLITIDSGVSVAKAWQRFTSNEVAQMPVRGGQGEIVGLLNRTDLLKSLHMSSNETLVSAPYIVEQVMEKQVIAAAPVTDVRRIAAMMVHARLNAIPIVNEDEQQNGKLIGIVSRSDVLAYMANNPHLSIWS